MMSEDQEIRASESIRRSPWGPEAIVQYAPVLEEVIHRDGVQYDNGVDVAVVMRLAPGAAALEPDEDDPVAERLQQAVPEEGHPLRRQRGVHVRRKGL